MSEAPYPPAEPPADGDRTSQVPPNGMAPRFSASASVPVPLAAPGAYGSPVSSFAQDGPYGQQGQGGQGAQFGQGGPPYGQQGQGAQFGQDGSHGQQGHGAQFGQDGSLGQPPAGQFPNSGHARGTSVPAPATQPNQPPYGPPTQGYPGQPGATYGSSAGQQSGSPAGQGQFGPPPPGQGSFGAGPSYGQPPTGGAPGPSNAPGYAGGGYDRQTGPAPVGQQQMGPGAYGSPVYGQPPGDHGRPRGAGQAPAGGWSETDQEAAPRKSKRGLIIASIAVVILIVVGVGGFVGWSLTNQTSNFTVGACVKQVGSDAVVTDCAGTGVYKITNIVQTQNGCPDANQPSLVLTPRVGGSKQWACLAPSS